MFKFFEKIKTYLRLSKVTPIARRCFVKNGFDGAMTALGLVIGVYMAGGTNSLLIILTGISISIAMGLSGLFGAFLTEESERAIILDDLEKSMLTNLDNSMIGKAEKFATFWVALIDGFSPFIIAMISLIPLMLCHLGICLFFHAFCLSIGITLLILFLLGVYLGKVSRRNIIICGLKMLLAGVLLTIFSFIFKIAV